MIAELRSTDKPQARAKEHHLCNTVAVPRDWKISPAPCTAATRGRRPLRPGPRPPAAPPQGVNQHAMHTPALRVRPQPARCCPWALHGAIRDEGGRVKVRPRRTRGCTTTAAGYVVLSCTAAWSVGASVVLTGPCQWVTIQVGAPFALCSNDSTLACEMCSLASSGGGTCARHRCPQTMPTLIAHRSV